MKDILSSAGYISLYKRRGKVCNRELQWLKKRLGIRKAGYCGTLDPFAEGVLPIAINKATGTLRFFERYRKTYLATVLFGVRTNTQDITGKILQREERRRITFEEIVNSFSAFLPGYNQRTPPFSARKYRGERLYNLARRDMAVPEIFKWVEVDSMRVMDFDYPMLIIEVVCGTGTYIRQLCEDLCSSVGTIGTLYSLTRTRYGPFDERFSSSAANAVIEDIRPLKEVFSKFGNFRVREEYEKLMVNGSRIDEKICSSLEMGAEDYFLGIIREEVAGIYRMENRVFIPEVIVV